MYKERPELPVVDRELTTTEAPTLPLVSSEIRELPRLQRRINTCLARLAVGSLVVLSPLAGLQMDMQYNRMRLSDSDPKIHTVTETIASGSADEAIVFTDGFGSRNSSWITSKLSNALRLLDERNVWANEYAVDGIRPEEIASTIAEAAEQDEVTTVSLYGYSIGGDVSLTTACELAKNHGVTVDEIFLDQTPADKESIRPKMRQEAAAAIDLIAAFKAWGIDIEYSSVARLYVDQVYPEKIGHLGDTPFNLMRDQLVFGTRFNAERQFECIANASSSIPFITYIKPTDSHADYMVDDDRSVDRFAELSAQYGFPFSVIEVDGLIHSRPDLTIKQYESAFAAVADERQVARFKASAPLFLVDQYERWRDREERSNAE